jgi:hypothetical protein
MKNTLVFLLALFLVGLNSLPLSGSDPTNMKETDNQLLIVWTSGDPDVAHKMVFMYAYNAQKNEWWDQVTLLVWGPSAKLTSEDAEIQESLQKMKEEGVELLACKGCADQYGVSDKLEEIGITVQYTGTYLTDYIKSGKKIITF